MDADTRFHYRQTGDVVWATYLGGGVAFGTLTARVRPDGKLDMRYQQVSRDGALKTGRCLSTPEVLPDGRLRLHESWRWTEGGEGAGESQVEEVPAREVQIRSEEPGDIDAIREVNRRAFGQDLEGRIVDLLRTNGGARLSLVAIEDGRIVGHILYSPLQIESVMGAALGPMAVSPEDQRHGIGTRLVESGNALLAHAGCPFIVVLGHPAFYPRFGFKPASAYGITCEWEVPDEAFMVLALDARSVPTGLARYRPEFHGVE